MVFVSARSNKENKKEKFLIQKWVFDHEVFNPKKVCKSNEYTVWSKDKSIVDETMLRC